MVDFSILPVFSRQHDWPPVFSLGPLRIRITMRMKLASLFTPSERYHLLSALSFFGLWVRTGVVERQLDKTRMQSQFCIGPRVLTISY